MTSRLTRRSLMKQVGAISLLSAVPSSASDSTAVAKRAQTPGLALEINGKLAAAPPDEAGMRRIRQLGITHVIMGGPPIPWEKSQLIDLVIGLKSGGLTLGNMMISGFTNTHLRQAGAGRRNRKGAAIHRGGGSGGPPGGGIQLLCSSPG